MSRKLTGNRRLRIQKRLFKSPLLVLQVEYEHDSARFQNEVETLQPVRISNSLTGWKDAAIEEVTMNNEDLK